MPEFEFLNTKGSPKDWNDSRFEKLWLYNLHYFDYLNDDEVEGKGRGRQWKLDLVLRWIKENPVGWGNGWEPYPISLRVVNWIKWMLRGQGQSSSSGDLRMNTCASLARTLSLSPSQSQIINSLTMQVGWLSKRLEYHLLANHLLANAKALVFAGVFLGNEKWYRKGITIYRKELPEQICADGVHFERSAMYHSIILEDLLDCVRLMGERGEKGERDVDFFRGYAEKMLAGLKLLTGPDGQIAKFNDATEGIAKSPSELFTRAEAERIPLLHCRPRPLPSTSDSGFLRREAGEWTLLAKCGEIGPSYQPGHAHADTWSFELWKGARKVLGDTGCSTYVPGEVRSYERSTAAHNTVVIDGQDSSEVWASHRVGRRFDFRRHKRTFELAADGLRGRDELNGKGEHDVEIRFHLPPGIGKDEVTIDCPGELTWEECLFAEGWNVRKPGLCAVFRSRQLFPATLAWAIVV